MAGWNGSGGFTFPYSWQADAAAGIDIIASRMDTQFDTVSVDGFGNTLTRDGQGQPTANLPMAGFRHTGAAAAVGTNDYVILSQVNGGTLAASFASVTTTGTVGVGTNLLVSGTAVISTSLTIAAGGIVVAAGGAGIAGGLTVTTGGLIVSAGTVALSPSSGNVAISPGAGNVVIAPTGNTTISPTGTLTINPTAASALNNVVIGDSTPLAGTFTTATVNNPGTTGNQVVNYSQFGKTIADPLKLTFPGGGALAAGTGTSSTGGTVTIAYGVTYAAAPIVVCCLTGSATDAFQVAVQSAGTASFVAFATTGGAGTPGVGFNWQAIGGT